MTALLLLLFVRFVGPREGAQVIGPTTLEVATDAAEVDRSSSTSTGHAWESFATAVSHDLGLRRVAAAASRDDVADVHTAAVGGESITVNLVEVPLRVRTPGAVTAKDFNVVEDGVRQTIRDVIRERPASRFVFLVDRSQSMAGGKLTAALEAIDAARELLRPDDTAQIIFFNHNFGQLEDLPRTARATSRFADVNPSGGTSLRDAVLSTVTQERRHIIVLTDGTDRNSEICDEAALRRISGTNRVFFALVFDQASRFLENASRNTGGGIAIVSAATVRDAMRDLIADINGRYTLTYQSSGTKQGWRSIRIASVRSGVQLLKARKGTSPNETLWSGLRSAVE